MKKYDELEMDVVLFSTLDVVDDSNPDDTIPDGGEWMPG